MGNKRKKQIEVGSELGKRTEEIDFSKTQNLLNAAISDISAAIKLLDTKVSIIMSALGVITSISINCREMLHDVYTKLHKYSLLVSAL